MYLKKILLPSACTLAVLLMPFSAWAQLDRSADLVWQRDDGQVLHWTIRSGVPVMVADLGTPVGADWSIRGVGSLEGNGLQSIVWQHASGQPYHWVVYNRKIVRQQDIGTPVGPDWHLRGVGDVDGDGTDDLVWRHDNGQAHWWKIANGRYVSAADIGAPASADWTLIGAGDVDGDGTADLIWQRNNGQVLYWKMMSGQAVGNADIGGPVGSDWVFRATGDVDADGTADLIWQHTGGQVIWWKMQGGQILSASDIGDPVGPGFTLRAAGDIAFAPLARGLADFHSHQFAEYGFGGAFMTHGVDPSEGCRTPMHASTFPSPFQLRNVIRGVLVEEAAKQAERGECFPTTSNFLGQQMDEDSLRRAWQYGLRLVSVLAVNSEIFCAIGQFDDRNGWCRDPASIERQLQAAHDLEAKLDQQAGGPGRGWYRIARSPMDARRIVEEGKLAVVLGVEASNAFGCEFRPTGSVIGIINPLPPVHEVTYGLRCDDDVTPGASTARALALFERYWALGARHFFPVHNMDGVAGGTSLAVPLLHAENHPARQPPGELINEVPEIERVVRQVRPQIDARDCHRLYDFDGGRCNVDGLHEVGRSLVRMMANHGALIDIDHMSHRMKDNILSQNRGLGAYPFLSSHAGFAEINHGDKRNESQSTGSHLDAIVRNGGAFGPILNQAAEAGEISTWPPDALIPYRCPGTSEAFVQAYRFAVQRLSEGRTLSGQPAFVGVGFGSDFNGLAGWPHPRFIGQIDHLEGGFNLKALLIGSKPGGGRCYEIREDGSGSGNAQPRVNYPFSSPMTGEVFDRTTLSWSGRERPYDVSFDGAAHVGMIPDFVEELRVMGLADQLEPLWRGAEAYIRSWEVSSSFRGRYSDERARGVEEFCREQRQIYLVPTYVLNPALPFLQNFALKAMREKGCHGFQAAVAVTPSLPPEPPPESIQCIAQCRAEQNACNEGIAGDPPRPADCAQQFMACRNRCNR